MEINNKLIVTSGERMAEGDNWKEGQESRNVYKGPMDKDNRVGRTECGKWGWVGQKRVMEEKWGQL